MLWGEGRTFLDLFFILIKMLKYQNIYSKSSIQTKLTFLSQSMAFRDNANLIFYAGDPPSGVK